MLTIEMLRQSAALAGLTDAQLNAITEMSKNDENTVISTKIGSLHGQYDADIFGITGIKKNDGEKSYDYAKRVLNDYKAKADSTKTVEAQLTAANTKIAELQDKIAKGEGDAAIRQQLKDTKAQVSQLQSQLQSKEAELTKEKESFKKQLSDIQVDYAFQEATKGMKFKPGITETVQGILLKSAKEEVLRKGTPDFVDDGAGGKKMVFRGADGNILNNVKNNLNPYTVSELLMETSLKDVLDQGRQQTGGGTGAGGGFEAGGQFSGLIDLSAAKTQVEADRMIESYLLQKGLTRDSVEFGEQSMELRKEGNVDNLPLR